MELETVVVRKVNKNVYRRFREKAVEADTTMGDAVTEALSYWLEEKQKRKEPNPNLLLKLEGIIKTKKPVRWSEEIDETLYGGHS